MTPLKQQISLIPFSIEHIALTSDGVLKIGLEVVDQICAWIPVFHFLRHGGIGDFPAFVSISRFLADR